MPATSFKPTRHGFHFGNEFVNRIVEIPGRAPIATRGRCGGMAYAALDYYFAGIAIPTHVAEDFSPDRVPADGKRLADYIYRRLFRSMADGGVNFLMWTLYRDEATIFGKGVTRLTKEELPKLRRQIDAGRPMALGLISAKNLLDIGNNHQVVAYGYDYHQEPDRTVIYIYDNNYPDRDDVTLVTDPANPHLREEIRGEVTATWRGVFIQNYRREIPRYRDIILSSDVWVSSATPDLGKPFQCGFTVKNTGDYAAHCRNLHIELTDPDGQTIDHFLEPDNVDAPVLPGEERTFARSFDFPGEKAGMYRLRALYCTTRGEWFSIPTGRASTLEYVPLMAQPAIT